MKTIDNLKKRYAAFQALDARDKKTFWKEFSLNNALYVLIIAAIIYTAIQNPNFVTTSSIVNIIALSAANIPIAVGIAGTIVLTGTDLSAGRVVGLTACISASLLQAVDYVELAVYCHLFLDFFIFSLVVLARLRTQRKPMYERGWFWYS